VLIARRDHHCFELHFLLTLLPTLSEVYTFTGSLGFSVLRQEHIMSFIDSVLLCGSYTTTRWGGQRRGSRQARLKQVAGEVDQGGGCGDRVTLAQKAGEQHLSPLFRQLGGEAQCLSIDHYRQHLFASNWASSCRLSLKTKEPLMRVWNRKIRVESVLVEGDWLPLTDCCRKGTLPQSVQLLPSSRLCVDSSHGT
jgi:hypothetical protein